MSPLRNEDSDQATFTEAQILPSANRVKIEMNALKVAQILNYLPTSLAV
jgi:hypothetical protein